MIGGRRQRKIKDFGRWVEFEDDGYSQGREERKKWRDYSLCEWEKTADKSTNKYSTVNNGNVRWHQHKTAAAKSMPTWLGGQKTMQREKGVIKQLVEQTKTMTFHDFSNNCFYGQENKKLNKRGGSIWTTVVKQLYAFTYRLNQMSVSGRARGGEKWEVYNTHF